MLKVSIFYFGALDVRQVHSENVFGKYFNEHLYFLALSCYISH